MKIKFWGTRGSLPVPGNNTAEFGGNTTCLEIVSESGDEYIFDAGSGIRELGNDLLKRKPQGLEAKLFLSHKHWDHMQGFPFFKPAYMPGNTISVYSGDAEATEKEFKDILQEHNGKSDMLVQRLKQKTKKISNKNEESNRTKDAFAHQQKAPYFPVPLNWMGSEIYFKDVVEGEKIHNGVEVSYRRMNHPNGVFCYKITENNKSVVFATDYEHDNEVACVIEGKDKKLIKWAKGVDVLIYDGQYTPESYEGKKGWGHSTYEKGIDIALEAGVKKLIFTHHDPESTDEIIHNLEEKAQDYLYKRMDGQNKALSIEFAKEGNEYKIGGE